MSTLWTPSGEYPVTNDPASRGITKPTHHHEESPKESASLPTDPSSRSSRDSTLDHDQGSTDRDPSIEAQELRRQLAEAPAEVVVANHCYGLFELAAVYLSEQPPLLAQAQLAIDALSGIVATLGDRLGEAAPALQQALSQMQVAFVEISQSQAK